MQGNFEIDVADVPYLTHRAPLLARIYRPRGPGPFQMMIELHGGAWCSADRTRDAVINEAMARSGIVVASLDFRMPPEAAYPASVADINYGIRWLKSRAAEFGGDPRKVGISGTSSGGHLAMLSAMRPSDPRYAALPLAGDAQVRCVVMLWPVIDPLGRYLHARERKTSGKPYPEYIDTILPAHDAYWQSEAAMSEGSPLKILERGEKVEMPPALSIQGADDEIHPRTQLEDFVRRYRSAGGYIEAELVAGEGQAFILRDPKSSASRRAIERVVAFVHKTL